MHKYLIHCNAQFLLDHLSATWKSAPLKWAVTKTFVATSYVSVTMQSNHKVKTRDKQQAAVTLLRISIPTHTALSDRTIRAQCLSLHVLL